MTNAVVTQNQRRGRCPEDYTEVPTAICCKRKIQRNSNVTASNNETSDTTPSKGSTTLKTSSNPKNRPCHPSTIDHKKKYNREGNHNYSKNTCIKEGIKSFKSHGRETGECVEGDREKDDKFYACEVRAWCPVELDVMPIPNKPLIKGSENFTVFIKNMISFPLFDLFKYRRDNMPNGKCAYIPEDKSTWLCSIFRIGDIVKLARGKLQFKKNLKCSKNLQIFIFNLFFIFYIIQYRFK